MKPHILPQVGASSPSSHSRYHARPNIFTTPKMTVTNKKMNGQFENLFGQIFFETGGGQSHQVLAMSQYLQKSHNVIPATLGNQKAEQQRA